MAPKISGLQTFPKIGIYVKWGEREYFLELSKDNLFHILQAAIEQGILQELMKAFEFYGMMKELKEGKL